MYWIAFTLGFFGSLHCIGMCGPLALAVQSSKKVQGSAAFFSSLQYNTGRTIGYVSLGLLFGILGSAASFGGVQRGVSILLGVVMVLFFLFSINPDHLISKVPAINRFYTSISQKLFGLLRKSERVPSLYLGTINGFLPCGLVYIAIAGAISLSNIWGSIGFMLFFGLGTFPAMIGVTLGHQAVSQKLRMSLKRLYPIITLVMGAYLIYRGLMSKLPLELDFFEALRNPVMCH
ncbi:MAG: sulfite exporter TauE/SafE family protein [Saprospiraceae bacterium]|nr:sulfite exporter TauE/SafE family protein [Saprospiraceae bacterium]MBP6566152.1 sulfite exporter TauE/SafE family protein [Saprospiraceae bacterium]